MHGLLERWLLLTAAAIATAGCGDGAGNGGTGEARPSLGCSDGTLDQSVDHIDLTFDGLERSYELYVPPQYDGSMPLPLVVNFHGLTSSGMQQEFFSDMNETSDARGFVVAYPNGTENSWNAGTCCPTAVDNDIDDVGFARAVVEDLGTRGCIDEARIYATGMSNGGFMTHRLACEAADIFAAAAPVAAVLLLDEEECSPARPISIVTFHGTADTLVEYEGGGLLDFPSAAESHAGWAARNGCAGDPAVTFSEGDATCESFEQCDQGVTVTLCTVEGGGHCWPGQPLCPFGEATEDISANQAMLDLFESVSLP